MATPSYKMVRKVKSWPAHVVAGTVVSTSLDFSVVPAKCKSVTKGDVRLIFYDERAHHRAVRSLPKETQEVFQFGKKVRMFGHKFRK